MTKIKEVRLMIYLIDQEVKEVIQSQILTKQVVLAYLVVVTIDLVIPRVAL